MATYFVRKSGNDGSAGTSAGAAWLTIGKALGAAGIASGDTVYIGAGVYRESVTVAMTSAVAETFVIADVEGSQTGDAGEVRWTARTTNDKTAPTTKTLDLAGRDHLTFQRLVLEGGTTSCVDAATTPVSTNVKFQDCTFISGTGAASDDQLILWDNSAGEAATWTVERCVFLGTYGGYIKFNSLTTGSSDYDLAFTVRNCLFVGGAVGGLSAHGVIYGTGGGGGSGSGKPGGIVAQNCTCLVGGADFMQVDANYSTTTTCKAKNCVLIGGGLNSGTSGSIVEDYNVIVAATTRTNVSAGGSSKTGTNYALLLHIGQALQQLRLPRPFATPTIDSPLLGFGNDTSNPTDLTTDFLARPRPSGPGVTWASADKAVGYLEHHDFGVREASTVDSGSTYAVKVSGPGDLDFKIPVDAVSTTISVKVYRDTNYGGGTLPQIILLAQNELGVATQTVTDAGSASAFNTISLSAFTPSSKGWVTIRLNSQSAATGVVYWDTISVT